MLLYRPPRGLIPRRRLEERLAQFNKGEWVTLVESSLEHAMNGITMTDIESRTAKAFHLTQVGELSSARHVLESSPVAPGDEATKRILTDEARTPSKPRSELDPAIADFEPEVPFDLDVKFLHNLRTARKGCAGGGPSGMTAEHLKVGLESPVICGLMGEVACQCARAKMPLRLGGSQRCRSQMAGCEASFSGMSSAV